MKKIIFFGFIILLIISISCVKKDRDWGNPYDPQGDDYEEQDGVDDNNGSGSFLAGTLNFNPGIVGKGCTVKIDISDSYSIYNIDSTSLGWTRGTLSSNVYYWVNISGKTPSERSFFSKATNLYSPSVGNTMNISVSEVYDPAGVEWNIPDLSYEIAGLCCDSSGNIISLEFDMGNYALKVRKYSSLGVLQQTLVSNTNVWNLPAFNLDSKDNIFLCYETNGNVVLHKYGNSGVLSNTYYPAGLSSPRSIAIDPINEDIFIADDSSGIMVYKFDNACNPITSFGGIGPGNGLFSFDTWPVSIAIDSSRNVIVTDNGNALIQKFDNDGIFQSQFSAFSDGKLTLDSSDNIYLGPRKFSNAGVLITIIGYDELAAVSSTGDSFYGAVERGIKITKYNKL